MGVTKKVKKRKLGREWKRIQEKKRIKESKEKQMERER